MLRLEVPNFSRFHADAKRNIVTVTKNLDLCRDLYSITFTQRHIEAVHSTNGHLDGSRIIGQQEHGAGTSSSQFALTLTCEVNHAFERDHFKVRGLERGPHTRDGHLSFGLRGHDEHEPCRDDDDQRAAMMVRVAHSDAT